MTTDAKRLEREQFDAYNTVVAALAPYVEGAASGDMHHLRKPFADHATMAGIVGGAFMSVPIDAVMEFDNQPSPDLEFHIAWIDISGPVAVAKIEFINWGGNRYTDYLTLLPIDGKWQIHAKVFDAHSAGGAA